MRGKQSKVAARHKVHTPTIACINQATADLKVDFDRLIAALQVFVDEHVAPVWGTPAKLVKASGHRPGCWAIVFLDHWEHGKRLAYHELTPDGMPQSKVFVETVQAEGTPVSMAASHELVEMLVDPDMNRHVMKPDGTIVHQYEAADPVQDTHFLIDRLHMTNFVYPAYFESFHKPRSVPFDHLKKLKRPFELSRGGYQKVFVKGRWKLRFGSLKAQKRWEELDRHHRRLERRAAVKRRRSAKTHALRPKSRR